MAFGKTAIGLDKMAIGFDKTAIGFIKRPWGLAGLDKTAIEAGAKTAIEAGRLDKTAIRDKMAIGLGQP